MKIPMFIKMGNFMKISFKKFISSALATVMAMACVGVVNVSSVFAAENVYYLYYDGGNLVNTNDFLVELLHQL